MISTSCHYSEDIFQSSAHEGLAAIMTKLPVDSDLDSSSSDSDDEDDTESILDGYAPIIWTNLEETIDKINDILVVDRRFLHSDIVASVSDPLGQTGIVADVDLTVDLKDNSGEIMRSFNSRKLQRIKAFVRGDYVIHGSWLGRVDEVVDNVTVLFNDGSKCKIMAADPECLVPISKNPIENAHDPYHPGQHVRAASSTVFKNARWICGTWKSKHIEGTVSHVSVGSVYVYWIAAASSGCSSQPTTIPARQHDPKQLKLLPHLSFAKWQLGDWCFLPKSEMTSEMAVPAAQDLLSNVGTQTMVENNTLHPLDYGTPVNQDKRGHTTAEIIERALVVVNVKTKVDVIWQDGTRSFGIDSRNLLPVDNMGDHNFWPEQYVLEKALDDNSETQRVGIVESEDSKERTACVRWLKPVKNPEDTREFDKEVVSVYELAEHPDYNYFIGDIVIWLSPISSSPEVFWTSGHRGHKEGYEDKSKPENDGLTTAKQKTKIGESFKESYLSWFGYITGLQEGNIEVAWADGTASKVGPQEIFVIDRDDYDGSGRSTFEESTQGDEDGVTSWETIDSEKMDVLKEEEQLLKKVEEHAVNRGAVENDDGLATMKNTVYTEKKLDQEISGHVSFPRAIFAFIAQFAYGLLGFRRSKELTETSNSELQGGASQDQGLKEILDTTQMIKAQRQKLARDSRLLEHMTKIGDKDVMLHNFVAVPAEKEKAELKNESECKYCSGNEEIYSLQNIGEVDALDVLGKFKSSIDTKQRKENCVVPSFSSVTTPQYLRHFDSVKDPLDHYFLNEKSQPTSQRKWTKKVQQEWSILEECLPDGIYVRIYEDRMDILRAVIIGAVGTPYQDGLFFFDLQLPPDYPNSPPLIYYHSGGLRLNPNLYETGKICLSLLNTWTGRGNEVWDPTNSSILQVLVSIQGLVLNPKPYFNEAGYDKQIGTAEGEKNSLSYNENSFLLCCKSMLYLLRRPPKHFELLIKKHFQDRGHYILRACDAYMKGAQVGSLSEDVIWPSNTGADFQDKGTVGFKLMLAKIIPKLVAAFSDVGVEYQQYAQLVAK